MLLKIENSNRNKHFEKIQVLETNHWLRNSLAFHAWYAWTIIRTEIVLRWHEYNYSRATMSSNDWIQSKLIVSALKPAKIATKLFQSELMTAGDFLGPWLKLKIDTEKVNTIFSKALLKNMIVRENLLFESKAILTSIFLDPRYKLTLSEEQILNARNNLLRTYETIKKLNKTDENLESQVDSSSSEEMDEVEILLKQNDKNAKSQSVSVVHIRAQIDSYWRESRIKKSECILKFWAKRNLIILICIP